MMMRQAYLEKVKTHLSAWQTLVTTLQDRSDEIQPMQRRIVYNDQLRLMRLQLEMSDSVLEDLIRIHRPDWESYRQDMLTILEVLQTQLEQLREAVEDVGYDISLWIAGIFDEASLHSLEWSEVESEPAAEPAVAMDLA